MNQLQRAHLPTARPKEGQFGKRGTEVFPVRSGWARRTRAPSMANDNWFIQKMNSNKSTQQSLHTAMGAPRVGGGLPLASTRRMVHRQLSSAKTPSLGQRTRAAGRSEAGGDRRRQAPPPLPGRTRRALRRTCAPRNALGSEANARRGRARGEPPAKCPHLATLRQLLAPQLRQRRIRSVGPAPPPGDALPQPHLSPQPPPPPPSQEPPGRLRSPRCGSIERNGPAQSRPRWRPRSRGARTRRAVPGAVAAATAAPGRTAGADSPPTRQPRLQSTRTGARPPAGLGAAGLRQDKKTRRGAESPWAPPRQPRGWRQSAERFAR